MPTHRWIPTLLFIAAFALGPAPARAGTYDVYSCRLPNGGPTGVDGWVATGINAYNDCGPRGGLVAQLSPGIVPPQTASGWRFAAPPDVRITGFTIHRAAEAAVGYPSARDYFSSYDDAPPLGQTSANPDYCMSNLSGCTGVGVMSNPLAPENKFERSGLAIRSLTYQIMCWNFGTPAGASCPTTTTLGRLRIFSSRFSLLDESAPTFEGDLVGVPADGTVVAGAIDLTFTAADRGSGVARTWIEMDGVPREQQPVEPSDASCALPYTEVVPCSRRVSHTHRFDAKTFGEGLHRYRLGIVDAAGNKTTSKEFVVGFVPPPEATNGHGATRSARLATWFGSKKRRASLTVRHRTKPVLRGVLAGTEALPIADAMLEVSERVAGTSQWRAVGHVPTDGNGAFLLRLPSGPSRTVRVSYRAFTDDAAPSAYSEVALRVRAGVTLNTSRRMVRNGTRLRFSGRVSGESSARRVLVTIYALSRGPRPRIPVETVRANTDGRFSYTYRFSRIPGPAVYRFEARVPSQTGFPYLEGTSRSVTVKGRP